MAQVLDEKALPDDVITDPLDDSIEADGGFTGVPRSATHDKKIPKAPAKKIRDNDVFFRYMEELDADRSNWDSLVLYCYRMWPQIVRPDKEKYIDVQSNGINEDWIIKNHGSGDYMFILNDSNKPKNAKEVCTAYVKVRHPDYDPLVNLSELDMQYRGNRAFVDKMIALGKLSPDGRVMNGQAVQGQVSDASVVQLLGRMIDKMDRKDLGRASDPTDTAINKAFEVMARGNQAATEMMLSQMKQEDPEKLLKLITMVTGLVRQPEVKQDDSIWKLLLQTQSQAHDQQLKLMEKMIEIKAGEKEPLDEDTVMDKLLNRMEKMQTLFASMGGGENGGKKGTLEVIMQYAGPSIGQALGIINNLLVLNAAKVGINPNGPQPVTQSGDAINKQQEQIIEGEVVKPGAPTDMDEANKEGLRQQVRQYSPMIISAVNRGESGEEFAASIDTLFGKDSGVYTGLAALGEEQLIAFLKLDEQTWLRLAPLELKLRKFIQEFIFYGTDEAQQEGA